MVKRNNNSGFTLIELLVVVLIIGILAAIALPQYRRSVERTRVAEALTLMRSLYDSCERQAWEKGKDSCQAGIAAGVVNVKKMDILVKGTYDDSLGIKTENFKYTLHDLPDQTIIATPIKGDYKDQGAQISMSGRTGQFSCQQKTAFGGDQEDVCKIWGASTWNK